MHAIFGAEVIDIFDMKYNPENKPLKSPEKKKKKEEERAVQNHGTENTVGNE